LDPLQYYLLFLCSHCSLLTVIDLEAQKLAPQLFLAIFSSA
jgi:hypothetical protein